MNATTYAVDIAKSVFQIHWVDPDTGEIGRRKVSRAKFLEFFAERRPGRVVIEACGGAHHWARQLIALGFRVELLPAAAVRPFVQGNKDDAADARGIWIASQQPEGHIPRVAVKTVQQQAVLSLHRVRSHWVSIRSATINNVRGLLYEFGIALPRGKNAGLKQLRDRRAQFDEQLPPLLRQIVDQQLRAIDQADQHVNDAEALIHAASRQSPEATRLVKVRGIGPLTASVLSAVLGRDGSNFASARQFAASQGLVPRHSGTGGKVSMGGISKRCDPYVRTLLIAGARAVVTGKYPPPWAVEMLKRRPINVVVVACANKLARIAWALVARSREYREDWKSQTPQAAS